MLPKKVRSLNQYNLRNKNNISKQPMNSTLRINSFVNHMTDKWNAMDDEIKYIGGLNEFTHHLKKKDKKPPKYYCVGDRRSNIHHARMRLRCSLLSDDLHKMKIIDNPSCECGHTTEDATHYLFHCPLYNEERRILDSIDARTPRDAKTFLYGEMNAPNKKNVALFEKISEYIKETKRFDK